MSEPKVSIITVNYKQPQVTKDLLRSIAELSYLNLEVILVNNEQDEGLFAEGPDFPFELLEINSQENIGFAGANNLGITKAKGDYLFFLNNDTELSDGVIEKLLSGFDSPEIGAVSPILRYHEAPEKIQFAGYTEINAWTGRNSLIQQQNVETFTESPYFHGAAVMLPRWVVQDVGNLPESYFLYYEELDWSVRVREKGYQIKVCQEVSVLHKESVSTGKNSPLKLYYQTRNRVFFMYRNSKHAWLFLGFFLLVSVPKNLLTQVLKRNWLHLRAFLLACQHALITKQSGWIDARNFS
ncbi:glycosyltransferase family 2 protein [Algoriphagus namhaensis]|uniref:Glycosyltransferase family 2 protein n=1 Tax=Algoriphagus namhaensis TaxID=915353 RepID=A0ABV8APR2_9BACT